jgi:sulfur carrier protein
MADRLEIVVNGQTQTLERPATVAELLTRLGMPARGIAVELNDQIVPKARHAEQPLAPGDRLEIVSLVGGG